MFIFDAEKFRGRLKRDGYVYVSGGCDENFLGKLERMLHSIEAGTGPDVYSLVPEGNDKQRLFDVMAAMTGEKDFTVSRHHILFYQGITSYPHKDRKSLQYSCAIGLRPSRTSRLVLWPYAAQDENTGSHYRDYVEFKGGQEAIEKEVAATPPVMFDVQRGDAVFFAGSRMYHDRTSPEGIAIYYLAVNTYGLYDRAASRQERKPDNTPLAPPPARVIAR